MAIEIRSCRDREEVTEYGKVVAYVFADNEKEDTATEVSGTQPEWTTCAFVDGKIATTMGSFPFTVRLNGAPMAMAGVTAVGTLPQYRRQGLLRQVMHLGYRQMREKGQSLAILWASMGAIYQRFGYGLASPNVSYAFDPRFAGFAFGDSPKGSIEMLSTEDAYPIIKQVYIQWATPRNLVIHRSGVLWNVGVFRPGKKGQPVFVAIYRNEDGEPRGYAVYTTEHTQREGPGPDQTLQVKDFIALDTDAFRGLWEYLCRHDLVGRVVMWNTFGEDDPARDLLLEPRMLNRVVGDGIWMRVVDVEAAIPQRPYGDRGAFTFAIDGDTMCDWNNGTWLLETDGTTTEISRSDRPAQMTMPINSLAVMLSGNRSPTALARIGRIEAADERALATADAVFHTVYPPHCPNGF